MSKETRSDHEGLFLLILFKSVSSLPIDHHIHLALKSETTTNKTSTYSWYYYPVIIFSILISLIVLTICISACDYYYSKNQQESKVVQHRTISIDNQGKNIVDHVPEKVLKNMQDNDVTSTTSSDDTQNA